MAAATRLRQKGMMVTCFEVAPEVGGIWNGNGHDSFTTRGVLSPIYSSLRCVLPKDFMSFSDIRMDFTAPQFPHHSFVQRYLHRYGEAKGVRAITRFNTKVESCRFDARDGRWKVITVNIVSGDIHEWVFDRVAVCTGQHHAARFPEKWKEELGPFLDAGGEVTHSAYLKQFRQWKGKHALVVGDGVSAYDCMRELQRNGARVTHSTSLDLRLDPNDAAERKRMRSRLQVSEGLDSLPGFRSSKRDVMSLIPRLLVKLGLRNSEHHAHELITKWLRFQSDEIFKVPRVGRIIGCDGRNVLCKDDPTRKRSSSEVLDEAVQRGSAAKASSSVVVPSPPPAQQESSMGLPTGDMPNGVATSPQGVFLDEVDVIVFATGYTLQFPFLHDEIRSVVEGRSPPLRITPQSTSGDEPIHSEPDSPMDSRGLYLGTIFARNPTLAFVGTQRDLLPPFMLMEAQSSFIANAFTNRLQLPEAEQGMVAYEMDLHHVFPELRSLYSERGMGLHSAAYFNALHHEMGLLEGRQTYTGNLSRRHWWVLLNWALMAIHKLRSMAPLKRKKQHLLFSNDV